MKKKKCDVIIPVYKSPEWVKLCVYALFKNTDNSVLNKVYLINDCDDFFTSNCLNNLKKKYGNKIEIETNSKNLGFIKTTNKGLKKSSADYALLLNTDCLISKGTIEKLINHVENDKEIGLICPISSNAANLTLNMFEGFNYSQMNSLLEKKFAGITFDACTVVGNCLLISKECMEKTGYLDEAYGTGYGEETDYQFKAMKQGFKAKVAIDTYVFHKSEVSFGTSKEKQEKLRKNRELFFSRCEKEYNLELEKYEKNDPIKYINNNLTDEDKIPKFDSLFYLEGIVQNAGGVHVVVDIVNYLAINNQNVNLLYDIMTDYKEIMLFNPINSGDIDKVEVKQIVSTIYKSAYFAREVADKKNAKLLSFIQGYESYFENGAVYGIVETSYKIADSLFTISKYLQDELRNVFNQDSTLIKNGINYDLISKANEDGKIKTISIVLRNNMMKGDWILLDIIKKISTKFSNLTLNIVYFNEYLEFPAIDNKTIKINKILGPVSRNEIFEMLQKSDVYIDCSLTEGFGLTGLEAMAAGAIPIVSNSKGVEEYVVNGENGFIVDKCNDSDIYIEKLDELMSSEKLVMKLKKNINKTAKEFDYDNMIDCYIKYLNSDDKYKNYKEKFSEKDEIIINSMTKRQVQQASSKRKIYYVAKIVPKSVKRKLKKIITFLYTCYDH